ncbi:MAG: kinase [Sphingomonadaceae bacterium]
MTGANAIASLAQSLLAGRDGLAVLGLAGAQGSGKSTLARQVAARFGNSAVLSLDDLYHTQATRARLAREVHPLFATRGVPGTHDLALGHAVLDSLARNLPCRLPRFDKGADERRPEDDWPAAPSPTRLLILEGWCLGAQPQPEEALAAPANALERDEDPQATWRRHANQLLATSYASFFARIDALVFLKAPEFDVVAGWRAQQEAELPVAQRMPGPALARFIAHYERITRHMLDDLPGRADLTLALDADRRPVQAQWLARRGSLG